MLPKLRLWPASCWPGWSSLGLAGLARKLPRPGDPPGQRLEVQPDQDPGSEPGLLPGCCPAEGAAWGLAQLDLVALLRPGLSLAVTWSPWQRLEGLARAPPQCCGQLDPPPALMEDWGPAEGPQVPPRGVGRLLGDAGVGRRAGGPPQQLRELVVKLMGAWGWGAPAPAEGQAPVGQLQRHLDLGQGPCHLGGRAWHLPALGGIGGSSLQAPWEHGGNSQPCVRGLQVHQELICSGSGWAPCSLQVRDGCAGRQARPGADSDGLCSRTPCSCDPCTRMLQSTGGTAESMLN